MDSLDVERQEARRDTRRYRWVLALAILGCAAWVCWRFWPRSAVVPSPPATAPVNGQPWTSSSTGMEFVWVKTLGMWVGKYEVTNGEYRKKEPGHDSKDYKGHSLNGDRQPVAFVNFDDAKAYAEWLTGLDRLAGVLPTGYSYRLPKEKEWLTFAQCGDGRTYPWGDNWPPLSDQAGNYAGEETKVLGLTVVPDYSDGHVVACAVELSGKSDWGLYGIGGNVWEACSSDTVVGSFGAWRGASWDYNRQVNLGCAYRSGTGASTRFYDRDGFRLVLSRGQDAAKPSGDSNPSSAGVPGMAMIPAGSFKMGPPDMAWTNTITLSAFYMDVHEVTKAKWDEVANWASANGYDITPTNGLGKASGHPVHTVTWYECAKWCNARSEKDARTPAYYTSSGKTMVYRTGSVDVQNDWVRWDAGYRLPTEAEWEKAARGGLDGDRFPWGDTITHSQANYRSDGRHDYDTSSTRGYQPDWDEDGRSFTSPAGTFAPNGYGLYDMAGNVWEWCWDWYAGSPPASGPTNPRGAVSGSRRVIRGGSWRHDAAYCRVAIRIRFTPGSGTYRFGFRAVLPPGQ